MPIVPASNALITIAQVKSWLKLDGVDANRDDMLQTQINAWSDEVEGRTGRIIAAADHADEILDGGRKTILPFNTPINSVSSLVIDDATLASTFYYITSNKGSIRRVGGYTFSGKQGSVLLSYNGGYAATPGNMVSALIKIVAIDYYMSGHGNKSLAKRGESFGDGNVTYFSTPADQEKMMEKLIRHYGRRT